jgi:hypothetical protein
MTLLAPGLAGAALAAAQGAGQPPVLSPLAWRMYVNPAYCYAIRLPVTAQLDTTDLASIKVRLTRAGVDEQGREVTPAWRFDIVVTPNPRGIALEDWLEAGSGTPVESSGLPEIVDISQRADVLVGRRPGLRKRVEGADQRRDVFLVTNAGRMYALSYPVLDLAYPGLLKEEMPTFRWILSTFMFSDRGGCSPASGKQ